MTRETDPSRSSAEREVFVAAGHAQEAQEGALGNAYSVQPRKSEPSRRKRFGVVLVTLEEHAGLTSCIRRR